MFYHHCTSNQSKQLFYGRINKGNHISNLTITIINVDEIIEYNHINFRSFTLKSTLKYLPIDFTFSQNINNYLFIQPQINLHAKLIRNKGFSRWFQKMLPVSTKLGGTKWSRQGGGSPIFHQTS